MKLNYLVLDLETWGHKTYKRFCNPLDPRHFVVATAYKYQRKEAQVQYSETGIPIETFFDEIDLKDVNLIIGQNFKFDMLWFWKNEKFQQWLRDGGQVWDTLQAEYLLRGQQKDEGMKLDDLVLKYGGTLKDKGVKNIFADGGTVLDIPKEQLIAYAKEDVNNTAIVFEAQLKVAKRLGMVPIIKVYNNHLLAVTEMEYNGMYIDKDKAEEHVVAVTKKVKQMKESLRTIMIENELWPEASLPFNAASYIHLGNFLYGGSAAIDIKKTHIDDSGNPVVFKSGPRKGEVKFFNESADVIIPGLNIKFLTKWTTKAGGRGTGEKVLVDIRNTSSNPLAIKTIDLILGYREYNKILSTYLQNKDKTKGILPLIHSDGCIHSEYNTAETVTGRLSSNNPNVQNVPPFVTDIFPSRYGSDGQIVELDFSQLEIVVQAYITGCTQMLKDVERGVDFHCLRLSYAENMDYDEVKKLCDSDDAWKLKRKKAKVISFQKSYGAHTSKISKETGLPADTIDRIFARENERYPEINSYYEMLTESLDSHATKSKVPLQVKVHGVYKTHRTFKQIVGKFQCLTGKVYTFHKRAMRTSRGLFQYWPGPDIMNYPVQGTAADIVSLQMGKVFRYMMSNRDKGLMINEVHDSVILDVKKEHLKEIVSNVKKILEDVPSSFEEAFEIKFDAPIRVDYNSGANWKEAK